MLTQCLPYGTFKNKVAYLPNSADLFANMYVTSSAVTLVLGIPLARVNLGGTVNSEGKKDRKD